MEPLGHVAALDGLRAVAVLLVLVYHAGFDWLAGGFLGVSVFFTLSGFLIASLLLREWGRTDGLDQRRFWARRFRRLTPAAWVTFALVLVMAALGVWDNAQLRALRSDLPWSLVDLVNWHFVASDTAYGASFSAPSPLEHFWSLAVETQFYVVLLIVIPAVLLIGRGTQAQRLRRLTRVLVVLTALSATASFFLARTSVDRAYFGTDTRAAEMLVGALLACVTVRRIRLPDGAARTASRWAAPVALGVVLWMSATVTTTSMWLYPWGLLLTAVSTATIVFGLVQGGSPARVIIAPGMVGLGRMSYGVYVLHWPIFLWLTPQRTDLSPWPLFALRLAVTLAAAAALYRLVERPIRLGRRISAPTVRWLMPLGATALVVGVLVLTADLAPPPAYLQERAAGDILIRNGRTIPDRATTTTGSSATTAAVAPTTIAPATPKRVLLVGDSIAASLEGALGDALAARGITFASVARPGCGVVDGQPATSLYQPVAVVNDVDVRQCADWIRTGPAKAVADFQPDLVVSISTWESIDRIVDGRFYRFGTPESDAVLRRLYGETRARFGAGGATTAFVLLPDGGVGRTTPPGRPTDEDLARSAHLRELLTSVTAEQPKTTTLDLASIVCPATPCPRTVDGLDLRPGDGLHYDDPAGAAYVAGRLADLIQALRLTA